MNNFTKINTIDSITYPSTWIDQIKSGDFNGDGNIDFVVARINHDLGITPSTLQVFLGDGSGGFIDTTSAIFRNTNPLINYVPRMIISDFNADGVSDIFCIDNGIDKLPFTGGQNRLFLSKNGLLEDKTNILPQGLKNNHGASIGDVNQDGLIDILVNALMSDGNDLQINTGNNFVSMPLLLPNLSKKNPYGNFGTVPQTHTWSALIDINEDKYPDMILGHWDNLTSSEHSNIYLNSGDRVFAGATPISLPKTRIDNEIVLDIKPIDLNGDSLPDLALSITNGGDSTVFYQTAYVQLLINEGSGQFRDETASRLSQDTAQKSPGWYKSIEVLDINRDGFFDIAVDLAPFGKSSSKIFLNDGRGVFNEVFSMPAGQTISLGDVNNDGLSDIIGAQLRNQFEIFRNNFTNGHIYKANYGGDILLGSHSADLFISGNGNDRLNGNDGIDTLRMNGISSNYSLSAGKDMITLVDKVSNAGTDTLINIERLQFVDKHVALDIAGNAGQVAKTLGAVFGVSTVNNKEYVGIGLSLLDGGMTYEALMGLALKAKLGNALSHATVVNLLHTNVMGAAPTQAERDFYVGLLDSGVYNPMSLGVLAAETPLNATNIDLVGLSQTGLEFLPV